MQSSAAIIPDGLTRRVLARGAAIGVALIAHGAALFALTYNPADRRVIDERPAAISVELAVAPPNGSPLAMPDQAVSSQIESSANAEPDQQMLAENLSPEAVERDEVAATDQPVTLPTPRPHPATTAKMERRPTPPVRRAALSLAPDAESQGVSGAVDGGATGVVGTNVSPTEIPSTWKTRLLSHLDRYKRYPTAARAKGTEGTALLSFGMDRDGRVLGYYLVRSSGCPELDDEVFAMLARAAPLPPAPPEVRAQVVQLVVPVRFRM